ncbi:MAG: cell division protein FtsA [Candidatus Marinimicrobia bacterium]|jgi:cell division protein FtsA|nr:cell division protein FtsA [Candidatus Neomarinimicrobiota bacterium]MBT3495886.1 cell division protein FtsA [Candidatus Neomarinimicrobiota bacterium]MBT3692411.1 cell division protein FtsA [Candidatus Neomarinimicrobiota bacterium]MBT3732936.1 cell division protein FtsA [Candidatus Neomarinimicrobiota bacterium]MBT4144412.1 cell division protein FtsA [Candidatus Neomarinimicrobiota bacterium]
MRRGANSQEKNITVGIDIGSSKICCAIGQLQENSSTKLMGIGIAPSKGLNHGNIVHRDQLIEQIEKAVEAAEMMADISVERAIISMTGEHIRCINTVGAVALNKGNSPNLVAEQSITMSDMEKAIELSQAVSLPIDKDILHVLPQDYLVDTLAFIKNPIGMTGRRLEARVHLVIAATTAMQNLKNCVEELGIDFEGIVFQPLASSLVTLNEDEKNLGVTLVDMGAHTTDITVYHGDAVRYSSVIPIGANSITNDIAVMLQIGLETAEEIKIKYGSAKASLASSELNFDLPVSNGGPKRSISEHEVSRYIEARMQEIFQLIIREISKADVKGKLTYGIVLTGGGAQLRNLGALATETMDLKVRVASPTNITGIKEVAENPEYTAALGLLLWNTQSDDFKNSTQESALTLKTVSHKISAWFKDFF